jgi:hypothetical protein
MGGATGSAPALMPPVAGAVVGRGGRVVGVVAGVGARTLGRLVATTFGTGLSGAKAPGTGGNGVLLRTTTLFAGRTGDTCGNGVF